MIDSVVVGIGVTGGDVGIGAWVTVEETGAGFLMDLNVNDFDEAPIIFRPFSLAITNTKAPGHLEHFLQPVIPSSGTILNWSVIWLVTLAAISAKAVQFLVVITVEDKSYT